jgi:hypothetical protein
VYCGRQVTAALLCGVALFSSAAAADWTSTLDGSVRYYSWTSDHGWPPNWPGGKGKGDQLYIPFGYRLGTNDGITDFSITARSGYVSSSQDTTGVKGSSSSFTDSSLSSTYSYLGWAGFQPALSLALNLPTGRTNFQGNSKNGKMDPDVVALGVTGEGFNFAPTLSANVPLSETSMLGFGVGYTSRGAFRREGTLPGTTTKLNPGDVTTFNASYGYQDETVALQLAASYSLESTTTLDGAQFYRSGDRWLLSATLAYAWNENWTTQAGVSMSHYGKNDVLTLGLPPLIAELFNSNSNSYPMSLSTSYAGEDFSIGPKLTYLYRDHNAWSPTSYQFLPAKSSWSFGLEGSYAASDTLNFTGSVERGWVHESDNPDKLLGGIIIPGTGVPPYSTDSWRFSIGASIGL